MLKRIDPPGLHRNPAFSNVVVATRAEELIFVGGQNGIDANGTLAGADLAAQSAQALQNVALALEAAGATPSDVVRLAIHIVDGEDPAVAFAAARGNWSGAPTATTVLRVAGLANPKFLVEIEAIAVTSSAGG